MGETIPEREDGSFGGPAYFGAAIGAVIPNAMVYWTQELARHLPPRRSLPLIGAACSAAFAAASVRQARQESEVLDRINARLRETNQELSVALPGERGRLEQLRKQLEDQRALFALNKAVAYLNAVLGGAATGAVIGAAVMPWFRNGLMATSAITSGLDALAGELTFFNQQVPQSWRLWLGQKFVSEDRPSEATRLKVPTVERVDQLRDHARVDAVTPKQSVVV